MVPVADGGAQPRCLKYCHNREIECSVAVMFVRNIL